MALASFPVSAMKKRAAAFLANSFEVRYPRLLCGRSSLLRLHTQARAVGSK